MNLKELAAQYFSAFSEKNIEVVKKFFSEDVILRDWEISANGLEDVVKANQSIFDAVETIHVNPLEIYQDGHTVSAELKITVNGNEELLVVDVIDFDDNQKIKAIRAYKGN